LVQGGEENPRILEPDSSTTIRFGENRVNGTIAKRVQLTSLKRKRRHEGGGRERTRKRKKRS